MIKARFSIDGNTNEMRVRIRGHAGSAPKGQDLVCAAASVLAKAAEANVRDMWAEGCLLSGPEHEPVIVTRDGSVKLVYTPATAADVARALTELAVIERGFRILAHNYPRYVSVSGI